MVSYKLYINDKIKTFTSIEKAQEFYKVFEEKNQGKAFECVLIGLERRKQRRKNAIGYNVYFSDIEKIEWENLNGERIYLVVNKDTPEGTFDHCYWSITHVNSVDFDTVNKCLKSLVAYDGEAHEEIEDDGAEQYNFYYGIGGECSSCRGGGCVHCEPNRFI